MDKNKIFYWVATGLMCLVFAFSAGMYFVNYETIVEVFPQLGFPAWLIIPLAIAKVLGIIAILTDWSKVLAEWAYAGFFFDAVLAYAAHHYADDGQGVIAVVAIATTIISRYFYPKVR